jgi:hypothetical protein
MPRVGFEPDTALFEWANTVYALDRAATVMADSVYWTEKYFHLGHNYF